MSDGTGIAWTDATWSPILGCSPASAGCAQCYALRDVWRMAHNPNPKIARPREGLVEKTSAGVHRWTGRIRFLNEQLEVPLRWRRPRRIFVANQADLFHEALFPADIARVFEVMKLSPQHQFQVLTKRAARMREFFDGPGRPWASLPNVWLGVSVEDQAAADERIPHLLATPAAVRFLSCEPLLGPVDLTPYFRKLETSGPGWTLTGGLALEIADRVPDWVIVGGESGPRARRCEVAWIRQLVEQSRAAGVPCFVKQLGTAWAREQEPLVDPKGGEPEEWPEDLRVRDLPGATR